MDSFEKRCEFEKVDDAGVIYGWALVCTENGKPYVDLQGDHVPEDVMVDAAVDFASNSRVGKDMHDGSKVADVLFTYPITASSNTLGLSTNKTGLVIGYKPHDKELLAAVKRGERTGFSIGGTLADHDAVGKAIAKAAGGVPNQHRRTFRSFKIAEISLVDVPAMEGATVGYVKRAIATREPSILKLSPTFERAVTKAMVATSVVDGHAHIVDLDDPATNCWGSLQTSCQNVEGATTGHSHGWTFDASGAISIAPDSGHTHSVADVVPPQTVTAAAALEAAEQARIAAIPAVLVDDPSDGIPITFSDEESSGKTINVVIAARAPAAISTRPPPLTTLKIAMPPTDKETAMPNEHEIKIAELEKQLAVTKQHATLTDAQRAHLGTLTGDDATAFLAKGQTERTAIVDAITKSKVETLEKANEVVYTSPSDGMVYRKSDDPRLVAMAKRSDAQAEQVEKSEVATIAKAVFKGCAGEDAVHEYVVKSIRKGGGDAALIEKAYQAFRGMSAASIEISVAKGINPGRDDADGAPAALAKFNTELATFAKAAGKTPEQATSAFLNTPTGAALYGDAFPRN